MVEPDENSMAMGMRIQRARKSVKLTQLQLSEKIGVTPQYISDLERGVTGCKIATLLKLCDTLGVSADFILRGQETFAGSLSELPADFSELSMKEKELMKEGYDLLKKAIALK